MPKQRKRDGVYWRKDRLMYWISFVDAHGQRQRKPGAQSWEEARQVLAETLARVKEEANLKPGEVLACRDSFADVADKFLAYQKPRVTAKSYEREENIVVHLKAFFTGRLADITSAQVSDYVTARLGKVSKSSVRKELNSLKHLFRLACGEWKLLPRFSNPCLDVTAPKVHDERTQHLSPEQFRRVLEAAPEKMQPIFALLTATGMRRSELLKCLWEYVDGSRIVLPPSMTKNNEPKEVHLNVFAQKVLASIPQGEPKARLFPDITPEAVSMAFHRVCQILKVSDIRLHDLRHTFATWLRQRGTELDVIASQLGHRDLRMTKRYARIASAQVKQAVNGLDSVFVAAQEPKKALLSHPIVTGKQLTEGENPVSLVN
jgi:integrase